MAVTTTIEKTLRDQLPSTLHEHVPQLARLLADVADGRLKSEEAQQHIDSMPSLAPLLRQLAGTQVEVGNTGISFGIGNDLRNATITVSGDIAGRDIINLHIDLSVPPINTSRGATCRDTYSTDRHSRCTTFCNTHYTVW